jgi:restriction endonuclease S subunit
MTKETISIDKSIYDGINKCFEKVEDINKLDIDIIPDAGLANIASFLKAIYGNKGEYDLGVTDDMGNSMLGMWRVDSNNTAIKTWKTVEQKFDSFCKNVRKDCMFITEKNTKNIYYLYELLNNIRPVIFNQQRGAAQPHVYSKDINNLRLWIPNEELIENANKLFESFHKEIYQLQRANQNLVKQRDLLLPRLMSGKLEVK